MSKIEVKKVVTSRDLKDFIEFHYDLYKGNEYDVPTLFSDDWQTLSRDKNAAFEFCEAEYFLAYKDGKIVGRVAAIVNHKANEKWQRKSVRFGWIDFIDDLDVSRALFDAVADFGRQKGMEEIIGPLGFTDFDPEGMLTFGFDELGTMATIYNYPYYPEHIEKLGGWEKDNDYVEFKIFVPEQVPEKMVKISEMIMKRYNLKVRTLTKKEIFEGGMGKQIFGLINDTFKDLYGFSELSERQIEQYVKMYLPYADLNLIPIVRSSAHWRGHHDSVAVAGVAEVSSRQTVAVRLVARASCPEVPQDEHRRFGNDWCPTRISLERRECADVLSPDSVVQQVRHRMGRKSGGNGVERECAGAVVVF